jgi:glucose/arabinose dehydrogenase
VALLGRADGLDRPFGLEHHGGHLYVASTNAVHRFPFLVGATRVTGPAEKVVDLPAGGYNNHWTRNLLVSPDGRTLYVTVGSGTNVDTERQDERDERRAAILAVDLPTRRARVFARGLRNPNGLALEPTTGALWTAVNERDGLGNDLVPDYITSVREGAHFGWPNAYYGRHADPRRVGLPGARPEQTVAPDYATGAHTATMDLAFVRGAALPGGAAYGALVVQRGSWNRTPMAGYRVVLVPFAGGRPAGAPAPFLTGWVVDSAAGTVRDRPSSVTVLPDESVLVTDDAADRIWLVRRRAR